MHDLGKVLLICCAAGNVGGPWLMVQGVRIYRRATTVYPPPCPHAVERTGRCGVVKTAVRVGKLRCFEGDDRGRIVAESCTARSRWWLSSKKSKSGPY